MAKKTKGKKKAVPRTAAVKRRAKAAAARPAAPSRARAKAARKPRPAAKKAKKKSATTSATRRAAPVKRVAAKATRKVAKKSARVTRRATSAVRRVARVAAPIAKKAATARKARPAKPAAPNVVARKAAPPKPAVAAAPTKARKPPALDRERRTVGDPDMVPMPPSSLVPGNASSARSGADELRVKLATHTGSGPVLTAGDVDADWGAAEAVGDEAPGGDNPTPDQDVVDDIGRALGVEYDDDEELQGGDEIAGRDRDRWELDPASSDDFDER
jgi:hypothetical protein